jgi:hypothetical protein
VKTKPYLVKESKNRRALTFYGPVPSREAAILRAILTFASDNYVASLLGARSQTKDPQDMPFLWSIQGYEDDELAYYLAEPEEAGWVSGKTADIDSLPLTGVFPEIFRKYGGYNKRDVRRLYDALVGRAIPHNRLQNEIFSAAEGLGLLPRYQG